MTTVEAEMVKEHLGSQFIVKALSLITGLPEEHVRDAIKEILDED